MIPPNSDCKINISIDSENQAGVEWVITQSRASEIKSENYVSTVVSEHTPEEIQTFVEYFNLAQSDSGETEVMNPKDEKDNG
jgi:hypothetical protein